MAFAEAGQQVRDHLERANDPELRGPGQDEPDEDDRPEQGDSKESRHRHEPEKDCGGDERGKPCREREQQNAAVVRKRHGRKVSGER
jgi:hypothetical protein